MVNEPVFVRVFPVDFIDLLTKGLIHSPKDPPISLLGIVDLHQRQPDCYLAVDLEGHGQVVACGYAIFERRQLLTFFNYSGEPGWGEAAIQDAVENGARRVVVPDTSVFLREYFCRLGFYEAAEANALIHLVWRPKPRIAGYRPAPRAPLRLVS